MTELVISNSLHTTNNDQNMVKEEDEEEYSCSSDNDQHMSDLPILQYNTKEDLLNDVPLTEQAYKKYHAVIVNKLNKVISLLEEIKNNKSKRLSARQNFSSHFSESESEENLSLPVFPINDMEVFLRFEDSLHNKELEKKFGQRLLKINGLTTVKTIKNVFKFVMTDRLWSQFSWTGQRQTKIRFQDYMMCKILVSYINKSTKESDQYICKLMKQWLQRIKAKTNRLVNTNDSS